MSRMCQNERANEPTDRTMMKKNLIAYTLGTYTLGCLHARWQLLIAIKWYQLFKRAIIGENGRNFMSVLWLSDFRAHLVIWARVRFAAVAAAAVDVPIAILRAYCDFATVSNQSTVCTNDGQCISFQVLLFVCMPFICLFLIANLSVLNSL